MLHSGEHCGDYEVIRKLGDSGRVYLAKRLADSHRVALKLAENGTKELDALKRLEGLHPSLPRLCKPFLDADENLVLVIEWVDGHTLRQGNLSLNPHQKLCILRHVADALACVHAADLVHRDVKPDNVMLAGPFYEYPDSPENVRLIDFDIAGQVRAPLTRHGDDAAGNPRYMPPEVLVPANQAKNERARDVFAFGVLGWELLTECHPYGTPTHVGRSREYYTKRYEELRVEKDAIHSITGDLPNWVGEVGPSLARCLSLNPTDRPAIRDVANVCKEELARRAAEKAETERLAARRTEEERLTRQAAERAERLATRRAEERLAPKATFKHPAWLPWFVVVFLAVTLVVFSGFAYLKRFFSHSENGAVTSPATDACCGGVDCLKEQRQTEGTSCEKHDACQLCKSGRSRVSGACADLIPSTNTYRLRLAGATLPGYVLGKTDRICMQQAGATPVCAVVSDAMTTPLLGLVRMADLTTDPGVDMWFDRGKTRMRSLQGMRADRKVSHFMNSALCLGAVLYSADGSEIVRFYLEEP